jgi:hypothetical protein
MTPIEITGGREANTLYFKSCHVPPRTSSGRWVAGRAGCAREGKQPCSSIERRDLARSPPEFARVGLVAPSATRDKCPTSIRRCRPLPAEGTVDRGSSIRLRWISTQVFGFVSGIGVRDAIGH